MKMNSFARKKGFLQRWFNKEEMGKLPTIFTPLKKSGKSTISHGQLYAVPIRWGNCPVQGQNQNVLGG
jgi:hypothetical protein